MANLEALESVAQMLVNLPDEAVESMLVTFDALLEVSGSEVRPIAAEMLKTSATGCSNPTRRERLLRAAGDVVAGRACARTADGLTSKEAVQALAGINMADWQPPADPVWPEPPASAEEKEEEDDDEDPDHEEDSPKPVRQPKPRKVSLTRAEFQKLNTRKASVLQVGGFRPSLEPAACNFGKSPLGLPGEEWPTWQSRPLLFVCQMNLAIAPAVPPLLAGIQMITFFIDPEAGVLQKENGADWRLRAYTSLEGLVPMVAPAGAPKVGKGFECRWEECEDHPNYDDPEMVIPAGSRRPRIDLENVARTKIGGYASTIQSAPWWGHSDHPSNPRYCLQINSEEKAGLVWGDGGTIYVARGTEPGSLDQWFLDWQCF
jgi:hypothetical protein